MDQKTWHWKKRSSEKSIDAIKEGEISVIGNEEENEKEAGLERSVKNLREKVASLLCECNAKDKLIVQHEKTAQEAIAGREKAEAEIVVRNHELEEAIQQKVAANERLVHVNTALKDYRHQLTSLKDEQDQRVNEAVHELEKAHKKLEQKLTETSQKLASSALENTRLVTALTTQTELLSRLERELEIRNRCADVANRQKLVRLAVKRGVHVSQLEPEGLDKRMSFVIKRLREVEEENTILKENARKQDDEIRVLRSKTRRHSMIGDSDIMSLMDDFVEMERLAIVSSEGKELVPVNSDWLHNVLNEISKETRFSKRSLDELLEDVRVALKSPDTETSIERLKTELENVKESKQMIEEQLENEKITNEDLDHQVSVAKVKINEANQKLSSLKVELEDRSHSCEELEATCLELQLQLASISDKDVKNVDFEQEKVLRTGWEITAASAKLAECQETIFSIGRQLKALGPPTELTRDSRSTQHSSLRDHMVADKEVIISTTETKELSGFRVGSCNASRVVPGALAIVPGKNRGNVTGFLRKLLFRRKRENSKKKKVLSIGV